MFAERTKLMASAFVVLLIMMALLLSTPFASANGTTTSVTTSTTTIVTPVSTKFSTVTTIVTRTTEVRNTTETGTSVYTTVKTGITTVKTTYTLTTPTTVTRPVTTRNFSTTETKTSVSRNTYNYTTVTSTTVLTILSKTTVAVIQKTITSITTITITKAPTTLTIRCSGDRYTMRVGKTVGCAVQVQGGSSPSGNVTWYLNGREIGNCKLSSKFIAYFLADTCSETVTPPSVGYANLTAYYAGDTDNINSSATRYVTVTKSPSTTVVSCTSHSVKIGKAIACTAKITGYYPSGSVSWSNLTDGPGSVSLQPAVCNLLLLPKDHHHVECTVNITGISKGKVTIQATYGGDANNTSSAKTFSRTVG